jgi:DNA (cytosine-5)-methyltransferase 1
VSWALEELLDRDEGSVMTESPLVSDANRARIDHLHDNDLYDLPNEHRPDCHQAGTTYKAVYGRMHWDAPAPTLTTGFMTAGRGRYVHPLRRRTLVPREAARLQGFPDTYRFETPTGELGRGAVAKGIGDAVPSILGYAAAISALGNRPL